MSDNTQLNSGTGGDTLRDVDKAGIKTPVVLLDVGGTGAESLFDGSVTVASSVLPTGAATAVKQDTGNASLASLLTELQQKTEPADTQTIAGTVTANAGTNLNTSLLALEAGGNLATIAGKDFATQTTLALVAKDATLTGGTAKEQIWDPNFAQSAMVDQLRGLRVSNVIRVFGDSFANGIGSGTDFGSFPTNVTIMDTATGGVTGGQLVMRTGSANAAASAFLQSLKILTFVTGAISGAQSGIQFPTTPSTWKVVSRKDGTDTEVSSASFNGTANTPDGNYHRYELFYQGPGSVKFVVDGVLLHSLSGQPSAVRTSTLDFPLRYEIYNDSTNTFARFGAYDTQNGYFFEAVYPAANLVMNARGSTALRLGPATDDLGYIPLLAVNAAQESGGNLAVLVARMLDLIDVMVDIRTEIRNLNLNICAGMNVRDEGHLARKDNFFIN